MDHCRFCLFLLIITSVAVFASDTTTVEAVAPTTYFNEHDFDAGRKNNLDTTFKNFNDVIIRSHLGNYGLAATDFFLPPPENIGFNYWKNNFKQYLYSNDSIKYYTTKVPYSDLFFIGVTKKEQQFKFTQSQNVNKNLNFSVSFRRIRSAGWYLRQDINHNNLAVTSNYNSSNGRYSLLGNVLFNSLKCSENGGISDDSLFEKGSIKNKKLIPVNIESAQKRIGNKSVYVRQNFNLGKKQFLVPGKDSSYVPYFKNSLSHQFSIENNSFVYEDQQPVSGFYKNIYNDSIHTLDSVNHYKITNAIVWRTLNNKYKYDLQKFSVGFNVGLKHELNRIKQHNTDTVISNVLINSSVYNFYPKSKISISFGGEYIMNGQNKKDYNANIKIQKVIKDSLHIITIEGTAVTRTPDLMYSLYSSNNFKWKNEFVKTQNLYALIKYTMPKHFFQIGCKFYRFGNMLYYDDLALPRQLSYSLNSFSAFVKKDFHLKNWVISNNITWQQIPDSTVIRLPEWIVKGSLFYKHSVFKGAMDLETGVDLFYYSSGHYTAYMPATSQFYIQNIKSTGNYPFIDLFINAKIKNVRIFFRMEHFNAGMMENTYYSAPHYPYPDRAFKIGINWQFFN